MICWRARQASCVRCCLRLCFCIAGSLWFTLDLPKIRAVMRPIYREMGLLPHRNPDTTPDIPG